MSRMLNIASGSLSNSLSNGSSHIHGIEPHTFSSADCTFANSASSLLRELLFINPSTFGSLLGGVLGTGCSLFLVHFTSSSICLKCLSVMADYVYSFLAVYVSRSKLDGPTTPLCICNTMA